MGTFPPGSGSLEVGGVGLAVLTPYQFVADTLALLEAAEAGALDIGNVHEDVGRAVFRLNEAIALGRIEPLDGAERHVRLPLNRKIRGAGIAQRANTFDPGKTPNL